MREQVVNRESLPSRRALLDVFANTILYIELAMRLQDQDGLELCLGC